MVKRNNNNWEALSMTERASLINTYIQNGVLDLKKMKEHYNGFGDGGRILDGNEEENQTLSNEPWYKKIGKAVIAGGQAARDARIGAVGAQQVRDLYSEGKDAEAQALAQRYAKANTTGVALAGGAASPSLLGDLLVTGATTTADTLIDGNTEDFWKNLAINAAGDVAGGAFQYSPSLYKWFTKEANDVLNIQTFDDAVNSAVDFYKRHVNPDIDKADFVIKEVDNIAVDNSAGMYNPHTKRIEVKKSPNPIVERGTVAHEMRHHEDFDLHESNKGSSFVLDEVEDSYNNYGRQKLTDEQKNILEKAYGEVKIKEEHPAINVGYKEFLETMFIKEYGRIPSADELNSYIENLPYQLLSLSRIGGSYATPWSLLKTASFPESTKKALVNVKEEGGKLNLNALGGRILEGNEEEQTLSNEPVYYDNTDIDPAISYAPSKQTKTFFDDYADRYVAGKVFKDRKRKKINNIINNTHTGKIYDDEATYIGGDGQEYVQAGVFKPSEQRIGLNPNYDGSDVYTHELTHALNDRLSGRIRRTKKERKILENAYLLNDHIQKGHRAKELYTTNTQLRRKISDLNGGVLGEDLDKIIEGYDSNALIQLIYNTTGYVDKDAYTPTMDYYPVINTVEGLYKRLLEESVDTDEFGNPLYFKYDPNTRKWGQMYEEPKTWEELSFEEQQRLNEDFVSGKYSDITNEFTYDPKVINAIKTALIKVAKDGGKLNLNALGGPLYNKHNPIESFSGSSKIPVVRTGANMFDEGGKTGDGTSYFPFKTFMDLDLVGGNSYEGMYTTSKEGLENSEDVDTDKRFSMTFSVPKDDPERTYIHKVNKVIEEKSEKEIKAELYNKTEDEIRNIQQELANEGHYDIHLQQGKNKNAKTVQSQLVKEGYLIEEDKDGNIGNQTITALQTMLVHKGYLPEYTESGRKNIDGIIGNRTREAYKKYNRDFNVDGIVGNKTLSGYLNASKGKRKGFETYVSAEGMMDKCAKFVSTKYETIVGNTKQNGVFGNAWNMPMNIVDAGGKELFNIYKSPLFDTVETEKDVKRATAEALSTLKLDYSKLLEGDVVGIYMPSSTRYGDVLKEGTTFNTHVGIVVDVKDGVPIIEHNILGKVRKERIDKLTGSSWGKPTVTVASRPKQGEEVRGQLVFEDKKSTLKIEEKYQNPLLQEYMDSVASSKDVFGSIFKDVDMDFIEKAAVAITKRETGFMNNKMSDVRKGSSGVISALSANMREIAHSISGTPDDAISQDLTKMKFRSLPASYRASIGLHDPKQLSEDPTITARAVTLLLCKNYDYYKRLAKKNPELKLTKEDIENATILSYNRGTNYTLGFDSAGNFVPEELEYLTKSSLPNAKERDINATNFVYINRAGNFVGDKLNDLSDFTNIGFLGNIGNTIDNTSKKIADFLYSKKAAHKPYLSSARDVIRQLEQK